MTSKSQTLTHLKDAVKTTGSVKQFIQRNFKHFNAAVIVDASEAWIKQLDGGGKMFFAMAGAMSTGEFFEKGRLEGPSYGDRVMAQTTRVVRVMPIRGECAARSI